MVLKQFFSSLFAYKKIKNPENLSEACTNYEYIIRKIDSDDVEMNEFLNSLGCIIGEKITVTSILSDNFTILINGGRYSIDKELARAICI